MHSVCARSSGALWRSNFAVGQGSGPVACIGNLACDYERGVECCLCCSLDEPSSLFCAPLLQCELLRVLCSVWRELRLLCARPRFAVAPLAPCVQDAVRGLLSASRAVPQAPLPLLPRPCHGCPSTHPGKLPQTNACACPACEWHEGSWVVRRRCLPTATPTACEVATACDYMHHPTICSLQ